MASRKPRKREYVPPTHEVLNKKDVAPRKRGEGPQPGPRGAAAGRPRGYRVPPPPSWRRTLRRLPIYFLLLFALQYFLVDGKAAQDLTTGQRVGLSALYALVVTIVFAPFMYWMERWSYGVQMRRIEKDGGLGAGGGAGKG